MKSVEDTQYVRNLLVALNERTDLALTEAVNREGVNRTTIVNRAVQVYEEIAANQAAGGRLMLVRPDGGSEWFVITCSLPPKGDTL